MLMRKAEAEWKGNLMQGNGRLAVGSGSFDLPYSFKARFEDGQPDTNPEELIGAAHAGCFTMALTAQLCSRGLTCGQIPNLQFLLSWPHSLTKCRPQPDPRRIS